MQKQVNEGAIVSPLKQLRTQLDLERFFLKLPHHLRTFKSTTISGLSLVRKPMGYYLMLTFQAVPKSLILMTRRAVIIVTLTIRIALNSSLWRGLFGQLTLSNLTNLLVWTGLYPKCCRLLHLLLLLIW